jgi:hypothetical protein
MWLLKYLGGALLNIRRRRDPCGCVRLAQIASACNARAHRYETRATEQVDNSGCYVRGHEDDEEQGVEEKTRVDSSDAAAPCLCHVGDAAWCAAHAYNIYSVELI